MSPAWRPRLRALKDLYDGLTPWQKTLVARHPERPRFVDYSRELITEFTPLAGDRKFGEDEAILAGFGRFGARLWRSSAGKGSTTETRVKHNFGMARPEGYRKAARLMELAGRFGLPVLSFVDTAGAYPGIDAEERGQAEAIARSTEACLALGAPNVALIIGEGGSGGAIAIATANKVLMLEHSVYSVISPEGAASILWRDPTRAQDAATAMKITAQDLLRFGVIDAIVPEPTGGAHRDRPAAIAAAGSAMGAALAELAGLGPAELREHRAAKFSAIGPNAALRRSGQAAVQPPSIEMLAPVICAAASEHRKTASAATCSTVTKSFVGCAVSMTSLMTCSFVMPRAFIVSGICLSTRGVQT
jgi:acetyl-CoA carboxylase carboxyl transferase subunit alpha